MLETLGRPSITLVRRAMTTGVHSLTLVRRAITTGVRSLTLVRRAMLPMPAGVHSLTLVMGVVLFPQVRMPRMPTACMVLFLVGAASLLGR